MIPSPYFSRNKAPNLYVADVNQEFIFQQLHETIPTKITWVYGKNTAIEEAELQHNEEDINDPVKTIYYYNTFNSDIEFNSQTTENALSKSAVQLADKKIESTVSFVPTEEKNTSETKGLAKVIKSLSIHSPVKSIITEGTELFVTTFLKYDQQNQLVHFSYNDNLFTIDCDKIDGICF